MDIGGKCDQEKGPTGKGGPSRDAGRELVQLPGVSVRPEGSVGVALTVPPNS